MVLLLCLLHDPEDCAGVWRIRQFPSFHEVIQLPPGNDFVHFIQKPKSLIIEFIEMVLVLHFNLCTPFNLLFPLDIC